MRAFTGTIKKTEFVRELKLHQKMDNFVRGKYWDGSKGCAVGCSLESVARLKKIDIMKDDHAQYETHLGIPEWLARLEDTLFEGMSVEKSKSWPVDFAKAIRVGADLEKVKRPFIIMILEHSLQTLDSLKVNEEHTQVIEAIKGSRLAVKQMIKAQKSGDEKKIAAAWSAAESAAESAARSAARSAAESAARSAARSAAESAAESAWSAAESAWSAAESAWSAAESAESAARSAAESAWSAWSAAWSAAESAAYDYYANRLLEMLKECK